MASIYQRKDGRWVAAVRQAGGRIAFYGHTETEARRRLQDYEDGGAHKHHWHLGPPIEGVNGTCDCGAERIFAEQRGWK